MRPVLSHICIMHMVNMHSETSGHIDRYIETTPGYEDLDLLRCLFIQGVVEMSTLSKLIAYGLLYVYVSIFLPPLFSLLLTQYIQIRN
jgi:hypothetical protein